MNYSTTYYWKGIATDNHGASTSGPLWDFTTSPASASTGTVSGTITHTNNGTGIQRVAVKLSQDGTELASTTTDSNGNFLLGNVLPGTYTLTASRITFWSNSSSVTVNAGETTTVSLMLWRKGDLNNDGTAADAGDLALMKEASVDLISPDWRYDLNLNGIFAEAGDQAMLMDASVGNIELL